MAYEKQKFTDGNVLKAEHLNKIEDQIAANEITISQKSDLEHTHEEYADKVHTHTANNLQVPSLTQGVSLTEGADLDNILDVGNYRCTTSTLSNSLLNCPCTGWIFTMKVGHLPANSDYIYQEITVFTNGEHWYRSKGGSSTNWSKWVNKNKYPKLTSAQKKAVMSLMSEWFAEENKNKFYYSGDIIMDEYIDGKCYNTEKGKFKLNCSTFAQFIMMGRKVSDIVGENADHTGESYSNKITKAFDFGYYFQFKDREYIYGIHEVDAETNDMVYYGFKNPLNDETDWKGSYSRNTYYASTSSNSKKQVFNTFAYANDMAKELYELGCEIPFSELDTGDIVFAAGIEYENSDSMFDNIAWRHITHVYMVYGKDSTTGELWLIDCTESEPAIVMSCKSATLDGKPSKGDRTYAHILLKNAVMCARMPIAFGIPSNVPDEIIKLKTPE